MPLGKPLIGESAAVPDADHQPVRWILIFKCGIFRPDNHNHQSIPINKMQQTDNVSMPRGIETTGRPSTVALTFAFLYVIFCALYVLVSSKIAADVSSSVETLERIEIMKGIILRPRYRCLVLCCSALLSQEEFCTRDSHPSS